jgi:coenzyme F420-reducing hydrogenase beta subunit
MKKALIITYYDSENYGAFLQAFATQEFLKLNGINAEILKYNSKTVKWLGGLYRLIKKPSIKDEKQVQYHNKMAEAVVNEQHRLKKNDGTGKFDVAILGSDEIWNVKNVSGAHDPFMFCRYKNAVKTISYAACAGNSAIKHLKCFPYAVGGIKALDAVGVRDDNTERLVKGIGRGDVVRVLDPTFLIDFGGYLPKRMLDEKYLFVYTYGLNSEQIEEIKKLAQAKKLKIVATGCYCEWADYNPAPTPFEWIRYIKDAEFVITSTFHGTVLSIQNRKSFAVYKSSSPKIQSVLKELSLLDRRVTAWNNLEELFDNGVEYSNIENIIEARIKASGDFLLSQFGKAIYTKPEKSWQNPVLTEPCYIARHKDRAVRWDSRSGGAFTAISDIVLADGGVVYGAQVNKDNFSVQHTRAVTKQERDKQRGSKYVQSDLSACLQNIKRDLVEDKTVLFTGTPCQADAVRTLADGIKKNNKLITLDFVCHGVPSPKVWEDYVNTYENVSEVNFRDKKAFGWGDHIETIVSNNKPIHKKVFTSFFHLDFISRPSCYECPYAQYEHFSDITLGDCWGLEKLASGFNDDDSGASMVFANTDVGRGLIKRALQSMDYIESTVANMKQPVMESCGMGTALPNPKREAFWKDYRENGIDFVKVKYLDNSFKHRIKEAIRPPHFIRFTIKKLLKKN